VEGSVHKHGRAIHAFICDLYILHQQIIHTVGLDSSGAVRRL